MEWIKEGLKLLINSSGEEQKEFEKYNNRLVLNRIRIISFAILLLSIFWIYMDRTIIQSGADKIFSVMLVVMHIISIVASVLFLIFYKWIAGKEGHNKDRIIRIVLKTYVFLYILFGAVASINSQRYTGNMYSYIMLSLIAAAAFTLKPSYMLFTFGVNHVIFLAGMSALCQDEKILFIKQSNSTVLIGAAFLLAFIFYRHRMMEFLYRRELKENEENLKKLFYVNPYPVFITRMEDGKIIEASERACTLLGIHAGGLDDFNSIHGHIKNDSRQELIEELKQNNSTYNRIVEYGFKGKQMWVTANYEVIDYHGEKCILTGIMDITEIRRAKEELSHYASTDALTGILNRRMGFKKLEELLEQAQEGFAEFVLCFLDINNLKYINDTYGHGEGDRYIIAFCDVIKNELNEEDIFFRMGGDEFIIVFKNKNKAQAESIWEEFRKQFGEKKPEGEVAYNITASHGLFYYCSGMDIDLEQIIEMADKKMYKEKQKFKKEYQIGV
ncbi:diguanylate cyclase domain-containing protein [Konateibacter massiliensis]|uniref:diguanylate cyclase domain-containing protein n=1 Tax=Konateibacter massiliensis TaxID=2002841 RepID=UPI0015D4AFCB|nr:diguanylate cyclase [Konateibacter massiliensis]